MVLVEPVCDAEELDKVAGNVGVTTGRLATEGGSTIDRLLEVVTNDGADWLAVVNALGIELTRGIAADGAVVWFGAAGAVATAVVETGVVASWVVMPIAGLLASKELGGGGTMASDDGVVVTEGSDREAVGTGALAEASLSVFLRSACDATTDGTEALGAMGSAARVTAVDGLETIFEIVSPPIRMAWGAGGSFPVESDTIDASVICPTDFLSLRSLRSGVRLTDDPATCDSTEFAGAALGVVGRSATRACGATSTITEGTGPLRVGATAATTAGPERAGP